MSDNVPYQEDVTRGELRHAMRGYNALGFPPVGYIPQPNGMMMIIIMAPPQTAIPDWRSGAYHQPTAPRQAWPAFDWRQWVRVLCVVAILGAVGYIAYGMASGKSQRTLAGQPVETGVMNIDPATGHMAEPTLAGQLEQAAGDLRAALAELLPQQEPAQEESAGWSWPPRNPVGDTIDGLTQVVMWLVSIVVVMVAVWAIFFASSIFGKIRGGK